MKIRSGFVSNSSSSSFIVEVYGPFLSKRKKRLITPEQEAKLKRYGFRLTEDYYPEVFEIYFDKSKETINALLKEESCLGKKKTKTVEKVFKKKYGYYNYGYCVMCNQDDVIEFLLKNRIPFVGSIHYHDYIMLYDGGEYFYQIPNLGNMMGILGTNNIEQEFLKIIDGQKLLDKQLVEIYLNGRRKNRLSWKELGEKIVKQPKPKKTKRKTNENKKRVRK